MAAPDLVDRLAAHKTLGKAPREELAWLASHGSMRQLNTGDVLTPKGLQVEGMFVVLTGQIAIYVDHGAGPHRTMAWGAGEVTGLLPYSRLVSPPNDTVAEAPTEVLALHRDHLTDLIRECHQITSILVHTMIDRARTFTTSALQDEKLLSLGKLSAGLAHELNNPAAAIERSANMLEDRLGDVDVATRSLCAARLSDEQLRAVDAVQGSCVATRERGVRSPLQQVEREEAMSDWLASHQLDTDLAEGLADSPVNFQALDKLAAAVDRSALNAALQWVASGCAVRTLASEIQEAAMRIAGLVTAIKGFTHMDQAAVAEPVDVLRGVDNTVTVLRSKARRKSASVVIEAEPDLPPVRGFVGELNQIWSNLIDNALDAIADGGRVEVRASRDRQRVIVRVVDNGTGIPDDVRARIFDPFFTTKPVGQGTGLGLDIVRRLVRHNDGDISVESKPGRTEFRVELPLAESGPAAGAQV